MPASSSSSRPAAFDALFHEHVESLHRLIRSRTTDSSSVDDILQETFVRFYRFYVAPGRLDGTRPVGPLLATIATREAARQGRTIGRQRSLDWSIGLGVPDSVGSDEHVAALHDASVAREAFNSLSPRQRRLLLQWELRRSTEALAATEQVTTAALKQAVMRARRQFRRQYLAVETRAKALVATVMPARDWLRTRVHPDPSWVNVAAASIGLGGWSVVALLTFGFAYDTAQTPFAAEPAPQGTVALTTKDAAVVRTRPLPRSTHEESIAAGHLAPNVRVERSPHPETPVGTKQSTVAIDVVANDSSGDTRSINSLTVQCEAGLAAHLTCTGLDHLPGGVSGGGDS